MKILLTGFDPFDREKVNPAFEAVKLLPDTIAGAQIVKLEVPTQFVRAGEVLEAAMVEHKPDVVICVGQAGGRTAITPEKVAINLMDGRIPDNYYIQILHYLMVTEFDFVVLKAQLKYDFGENVFLHTKHYKIERADVETDIRYLESAERDFWKQVQERKRPALILPEL